ncbi:MAG: hypothetical protein IJB73_04990 [Firmicutes bacterium]|nr:hypothetical protein [Bacillota bacterium]
MKKNKKIATAVTAVTLAIAMGVGGSYAWQSISQQALNEASDVINPGGRLHSDFYIEDDGDYNADIYVENFADDDIFARVQLSEYMECVINYGNANAEIVDTIVGSKSLDGTLVTDKATDNTSDYEYEYVTHYFDQTNATDAFWDWTMGKTDGPQVYYMPTFNMNKDSLVADRNGMYVDRIGGISNRGQQQYQENGANTWTVWTENATKTGTEIHDTDSNWADEVKYDFENLATYETAGNIATKEATHTADLVGTTNGLISMSEWIDKLNNGEETADYWVYDTDGWVYWSSPIKAGKTTGLLLDSIQLDNVMDDTWYYAIEATGQFVTAGDVGNADNTGFYADANRQPTENAEKLLEHIGAIVKEPVTVTISSPFEFTWTGSWGNFYDTESGYAPLTIETSDGKDYEWEWTVEGSVVPDGQEASYVEDWDEYSLKISPYEQANLLTLTATATDNPAVNGSFTIPVKSTNGMMIMVKDDQGYFGFNDLQFDNDNYPVFVTNSEGKVQNMTALEIVNTDEVDPNTKVVRGDSVTIHDDDGESSVTFDQGFYVDIAPTEDVSHVLLKATLEDGSVVEMYVSIWYDGIWVYTNDLSHLYPKAEFVAYVSNEDEVPADADGNRSFTCDIDWNGIDSDNFKVEQITYTDHWGEEYPGFKITHNCEEGQCTCVDEATEIKIKITNANSSAQSGETSVYVVSEKPSLEIGTLNQIWYDEWDEYVWDSAVGETMEVESGKTVYFGVNNGYTSADWTLTKGEDEVTSTDSSQYTYTFSEAGTYVLTASRNGWKSDSVTITVTEANATE